MKQKNYAVGISGNQGCPFPNPFNPLGCAGPTQAGKGYISKGIDFSVVGQVSPSINLSFSYSFLNQKYVNSGATEQFGSVRSCAADSPSEFALDGSGFACPRHTIKFFGTYRPVDPLTVGGGVVWKSGTTSTYLSQSNVPGEPPLQSNVGYEQSSYAVVDLMARYQLSRKVTLSANIYNLFDKTYLTSTNGRDSQGGFWGAPRNVMVSLGFKY
jgi:outer membrane receptor for ferric coprogen and ferric-rhodotorulic acid